MRFAGLGMIRCAKQDALRSFSEGGPVYYVYPASRGCASQDWTVIARDRMYYVYLIESLSVQGERYVGMTTDLRQRLREHEQGKSSHTTKFSLWKLITYVVFTDRAMAEALSVIYIPVHVMNSIESDYGNWATESFSLVDLFNAPSQLRS